MLPVIAIVGRPNVGKSTLFNQLTRSRDALVASQPGLTRDRQYGQAVYNGTSFIVIDTGGIGEEDGTLDDMIGHQVKLAVNEADVIIFLVDARAGLTPADENIAQELRRENKTIYFVLNKIDGLNVDIVSAEFHRIGLGAPIPIAATHRRGINKLIEKISAHFPKKDFEETPKEHGIKIAIIGRPNVGKSTLVNRILGEERVMVFDEPGTTRDSIYIELERRGKRYTLIDTAGVRRRGKISDKIEKFSVIKTLQAIDDCNVVIFLVDAREGIVDQDLKLVGHILNSGKALVIAVNKWDGLSQEDKDQIKKELNRRLVFLDYAKKHFISALHGTGVGNLFSTIDKAYQSSMKKLSTPEVTRFLQQAVGEHAPPLVGRKRIKLKYAHAGGRNPPIIVIHGKHLDLLLGSYKRYLENFFREHLNLKGTPIVIEFKSEKSAK